MRFLYSRKPQFLLLLCWCLGLATLFAAINGNGTSLFTTPQVRNAVPALGAPPDHAALTAQAAPEVPPPAGDPVLNRSTALRITPNDGGDATKLALEIDYIPAASNGFSPHDVRCYYMEEPPAFVVSLGEHWATDLRLDAPIRVNMEQVRGLTVYLSHTSNHRLLIATRTAEQARLARAKLSATATGMKVEVSLPR
jgi:hypothetical protein